MLSKQPVFCVLLKNWLFLFLPKLKTVHGYMIMTQAHLNNKSLVSWPEHTTRPIMLYIRAVPLPEWYESHDQFPKLHLSAKLGELSGSVCTYKRATVESAGRHVGV